MELSFFIIRCITNEHNSFYWRICYDRIYQLYPTAKIFIVDDYSGIETYTIPSQYVNNYSYKPYSQYTKEQLLSYGALYPDLNIFGGDIVKLYNHWEKHGKYEKRTMPGKINDIDLHSTPCKSIWEELPNVTYIKSEFKGRGEILGYYYFHKLKPSERAIILHDSVFINEPINHNSNNDCEFLWRFNSDVCMDNGAGKDRIHSIDVIQTLLELSNNSYSNSKKLINCYKKKKWYGCFGIMSVVNWKYLNDLNNKYSFFNIILKQVDTRYKRQCLERIFGILTCYELGNVNVLYGNIKTYCRWGTTFQLDMLNKHTLRLNLPVTKVWSGR